MKINVNIPQSELWRLPNIVKFMEGKQEGKRCMLVIEGLEEESVPIVCWLNKSGSLTVRAY